MNKLSLDDDRERERGRERCSLTVMRISCKNNHKNYLRTMPEGRGSKPVLACGARRFEGGLNPDGLGIVPVTATFLGI